MKTGRCPKCGSNDVRTGVGVPNKGGAYWHNSIPVTWWSVAALDNYVCAYCGYVESYIANAGDLEKIVKDWPRVEPEDKGEVG